MTILLLVAVSLYAGGSAKKSEEGLTQKVLHLSARLKNVAKPGRRIRTESRHSEVKLATIARLPVVDKVPHRLSSGDRRLGHEEVETNSRTSGCTSGTTPLDLLYEGGQHEQDTAKFNRGSGPFNSVQKMEELLVEVHVRAQKLFDIAVFRNVSPALTRSLVLP